ncbi:hypothetical protein Taro_012802 [Colocasia esculenta]|uniref:Uncharacterized protein n=1 Tax=Colocasia esculenta TaxID=4460 RepID=A0A843UEJ3_COLES|nr:hypothetical protein [Colocasia esculenta]
MTLPSLPRVWDVGACVMRLGSHLVAPVFRELLCLGGCVLRFCFHIAFDSAGSTGVVFGPTLVVGLGFSPFRCFVFASALLEFLLLWLVRDWLSLLSLVREAHPPYSLQVAIFPAWFKCELQESVVAVVGGACYERGCWFARAAIGFVFGLRVRVGSRAVPCVPTLADDPPGCSGRVAARPSGPLARVREVGSLQ